MFRVFQAVVLSVFVMTLSHAAHAQQSWKGLGVYAEQQDNKYCYYKDNLLHCGASSPIAVSGTSVGIGTSDASSDLSVRNTSNASQIHFSGEDSKVGGYLTSASGISANDNAYLSGGLEYDGSNWIARHTNHWAMGGADGRIHFFTYAGDTVSNPATLKERMAIASSGQISISDTTPDGTLLLDVEGQIGGTEYCDENGANCSSAADLANAVATAGLSVSPTGQMVSAFPDAIKCINGSGREKILYLDNDNPGGNDVYYADPSNSLSIQYNRTTKAYAGGSASDCQSNAWSIADLYANDRAFNFTGENVVVNITVSDSGVMLSGFPDAIMCMSGAYKYFYALSYDDTGQVTYYRTDGSGANIRYNPTTKAYAAQQSMAGYDCVTNAWSISDLYDQGRAFNFTGGGSGGGAGSINDLSDAKHDTDDYSSLFLGNGAGVNDDGTDNRHTAIGRNALTSNTSGVYNTATGHASMYTNTTGGRNAAYGYASMYFNNGSFNTGLGPYALYDNTTGESNTATGYQTLFNNTTGSLNVATGRGSMYYNTTGSGNTAIGALSQLGQSGATTATSNTSVGYESLYSVTTGEQNTALGYGTLRGNSTGQYNTAIGHLALTENTSGLSNVAAGVGALGSNTVGNFNSAYGYNSQFFNTTASSNSSLGHGSMLYNTTGHSNIAVGRLAQYGVSGNSTGSYNVSLGFKANELLTTGNNNIAIGASVTVADVAGNDQLNIGNTIYGDLANDRVRIGDDPVNGGDYTLALGKFMSVWGSDHDESYLTHNMYYSGGWKYRDGTAGAGATSIQMGGGQFRFRVAPDGAADANIPYVDAMAIDTTGDIGLGDNTPDGTLKLDVEGQVGATEFCDENGANCSSAADLAAAVAGGGVSPTGQLTTNFPDIIMCKNGSGDEMFMYQVWSSSYVYYRYINSPTASDNNQVRYIKASGVMDTHTNMTNYDCVTNSWTIADIYANDRAFHFTGENVNVGGGNVVSITDIGNVDALTPTDGQVLSWNNTNSKWEAADVAASVSATGQLYAGVPDAIKCESGAGNEHIFYLRNDGSTEVKYAISGTGTTTQYSINYKIADGTYSSNQNVSSYNCVANSWTLSDLYANDRAFNFTGENVNVGSGAWTVSGTDAYRLTGEVAVGTSEMSSGKMLRTYNNGGRALIASHTEGAGSDVLSGFESRTTDGVSTTSLAIYSHGSGRTGSVYGQNYGGWGELRSNSSNGLLMGTLNSAPIIVGTNNVERLRIDATGNVGIGTTTPGAMLQLGDSLGTFSDSRLAIGDVDASSYITIGEDNDNRMAMGWNHTDNRFTIGTISGGVGSWSGLTFRDGNLGVGTLTPSVELEVSGTVMITGEVSATAFNATSDRTKKENIKTLEGALDNVSKLRGVSFDWKDKALGENSQVGVIAQEVKEVFPEVVKGEEGGMAVNYAALVGPLIEAVKELKAQNEAQNAEIEKLKKQLSEK